MLPISERQGRAIRNRLPSRAVRESCMHLATDAFEKSVAKFVSGLGAKAGLGVKKLAMDLTRGVTRETPQKEGRAAAGWWPFAREHGGGLGVSGRGVAKGLTEGKYRADLRGLKPYVELTNAVPYIVPIEVGTRPHVIRAKSAKALRFFYRGRLVFRKSVNHPGTRAYRPLHRAMRRQRRMLGGAFGGLTRP